MVSNGSKIDNYSLFVEASELLSCGRSEEAFALFLRAAENGDSSSQHNVGYMYDIGEGVQQDHLKALHWYKRAWKNDRQTGTCCNIASLYKGLGKTRSALYWWNKAIRLGDGDAALDFAKHLLSQRFVSKGKIVNLLKFTIQSKHVTPDCVDEAKVLLSQAENKR